MAKVYRRAEIEALTQADVETAKQRVIAARATRSGVGTVDHVLCGVNGTLHTLEAAKRYLISELTALRRLVD